MKRKLMMFLALFVMGIGLSMAQTQVHGTVVDDKGEPVIGATIMVKGIAGKGTTTDFNGKFTLSAPSDGTLVVSYVGMETLEVKVSPRLKIILTTDTEMLDEVVVVAFGTQKKKAFTGSASFVDSKELSKRVTTSVANSLVGNVAGFQMRGSSGQPGSGGGDMNIRGISSLYASTKPLIIVDGAPYPASLSNIPQEDIETVSILKDAASAALYGARGGGGVIIITTKKGRKHDASIKFNMKLGVNTRSIQDYDVITDPGRFYEAYYNQYFNKYYYGQGLDMIDANRQANIKMIRDLGYNVYTLPDDQFFAEKKSDGSDELFPKLIGMDGRLNPNATLGRKFVGNDGQTYYLQPDNWSDLSYKTAIRQEYNVSVNGASDKSSFYASFGYLDEDGIIDYSGYKRFSGRVKTDYKAKSWLKLGTNVSYINSTQRSNPNLADDSWGQVNLLYYTSLIAPIYPAYLRTVDKAGNPIIMKDSSGRDMYDYGVANTNGGLARAFTAPGNPIGANRFNEYVAVVNQMNSSFNIDVNITKNLKFTSANTIIWGQEQKSDYGSSLVLPKSSVGGELEKIVMNNVRRNFVQTLNYIKDYNDHNITAMLGHEYYHAKRKFLSATASGAFSEHIKEINAFANKKDSKSYEENYNVEGFFANLQYDYLDKYFGSASFRRDASSKFAKEYQWGNFWSIGGAYLISKENFMANTSAWLNMLKLKLSIGQQGNDGIRSYSYIDLYDLAKATDKSMSAIFQRIGNPAITWETNTNINAGVEFSMWKGRLSGNIDLYSKKTTDLLFWISVPESFGARGYFGNVGDISNKGVEITLSSTLIKNKNIDWNITLNGTHNVAKILKLPESKIKDNGGFRESTYWYAEGGEMYNYMAYAYAGVNERGKALYYYDEDLSPLGKKVEKNIDNKPGTKKSGTTDNIGKATRYAHGSNLPKLYGGFNSTLRIGAFDASISFDYQLGGKVYDSRYATLMSPIVGQTNGRNFHKDWEKAWTPNNTSSNIPRWQAGDEYATAASDRWLTNASYLNLQSFNVGYNLPENLIKGIRNVRVYVVGENLYFWSARKGFDPRYSYGEVKGLNTYSPIRNISGGVQFTL